MATVSCQCGAVEVVFRSDHDLFRLQCCCFDCSAALHYAHRRGGPRPPMHQCLDNSWFPNDFEITRGVDKVGAFLNFENADTTRYYCRECWTILFGDHPLYGGRVLVTAAGNYADFDALTDVSRMPPQARHFQKDLSAEQLAGLPHWHGDPAHVYTDLADNLMARFPDVQAAGSEGAAMNASILLAKIGPPLIPNDDPALDSGPKTAMQRMAENPTAQ